MAVSPASSVADTRRSRRLPRCHLLPTSYKDSGLLILHVTEAFGGGVASALESYVAGAESGTNDLVYRSRGAHPDGNFGRVECIEGGNLALTRAVRRALGRSNYDVIHVHSSWAGLIVRAAVSRRRVPIVYSPHCYAFERRDINALLRGIYWCAEWLLARNTSAFACCSIREVALTHRLGARTAHFVPNASAIDFGELPRHDGGPPTMFAIGRLSPAKDPAFYVEVAKLVRKAMPQLRSVWVGDGDAESRADLDRAGICVTGWRAEPDLFEGLAADSVYVHTARWEGFPISVVQAVSAGVPVVARVGPHFDGVDVGEMGREPADLARKVIELLSNEDARMRCSNRGVQALASYTPGCQREALEKVYREVVRS